MRLATHIQMLNAFAALTCASLAAQQAARPEDCNRPTLDPIVHVEVPGSPFQALPTRDGCWILVSISRGTGAIPSGVAVVKRSGGKVSLVRVVATETAPTGMTLTHDGKLLIAAAGPRVILLDVERMIRGRDSAVVGSLESEDTPGFIYVNVTTDDRYLFVSAERAAGVGVIDLAKWRAGGAAKSAVVGMIPTGRAPIALSLSPDGRWLYTTSQAAPDRLNWPFACKPEGANQETAAPNHAFGVVMVVDVARATTDPANSVGSIVAAGCNPVRLVLSPDGNVAYVSARNSNALLAFDTKKLLTDSTGALIGTVPVGTAPVGVAVIDGGRRIVVTNSNRFGGGADDRQSLNVIDARKISLGAGAVAGTIPAGAFPREIRVTADGRTLIVTNFASMTVQLVDVARIQAK